MAHVGPVGQGHHAALIGRAGFDTWVKHFPDGTPEMLRKKRVPSVDLAGNRP
jgi:hypothetical protein